MDHLSPTIDDIEKLSKNENLFEELINRLAEAEVLRNGESSLEVDGSGHPNAGDGGIDVMVNITSNSFKE